MIWALDKFPCYVCSLMGFSDNWSEQRQFHHLQGKHRVGAMIRDDSVGIPLCFPCHSIFHKRGERLYWEEINIDPIHYAKELWEEYNETRKL